MNCSERGCIFPSRYPTVCGWCRFHALTFTVGMSLEVMSWELRHISLEDSRACGFRIGNATGYEGRKPKRQTLAYGISEIRAEVFRYHSLGMTNLQIERATGITRKTVAKHLRIAGLTSQHIPAYHAPKSAREMSDRRRVAK